MIRSILGSVLLGVLVQFSWYHADPTMVSHFNLYKGTTEDQLELVATIPRTGTNNTFTYSYDVTDATPVYFGVSAVNNFGESAIQTRKDDGAPMLLGKPSSPTMFSFSVR